MFWPHFLRYFDNSSSFISSRPLSEIFYRFQSSTRWNYRKILVKLLTYQVSNTTSKGFWPHFCGILLIRPVRQIYFSRQKCNTFEPGVRVYATFEPWICPQRCRCSVGLAKTHLSVENRFRPHSWTLPRRQWIQIISKVVSFLARYFLNCNTNWHTTQIDTLFP